MRTESARLVLLTPKLHRLTIATLRLMRMERHHSWRAERELDAQIAALEAAEHVELKIGDGRADLGVESAV